MYARVKDFLLRRLEGPLRYARELSTALTERRLNIETRHSDSGPGARPNLPDYRGIYSDRAVYDDNVYYEPLEYRNVRGIFRVFDLGRDDVFYDIGCGKGRVLCLVARLPLRKVVGVELFDELCEAARQNAGRLRGRKSPIEIICADATKVDYSDATVFYWWNPFGEQTMRGVIQRIRESFDKNPRSIRIGYLKPVHHYVLDEETWLERYASIKTVTGSTMVFWRTVASPASR